MFTTSYPTSKRLYYPTSKRLHHQNQTYINIYKRLLLQGHVMALSSIVILRLTAKLIQSFSYLEKMCVLR